MPIYGFKCEKCGRTEEHYFSVRAESPTWTCEKCGSLCRRDLTVEARNHIPASGFPFTTTHLDGTPRTFSSEAELQRACRELGVAHRPDAAFLEKHYEGVDWKTGKQRYKEGSGMGIPGCWV